MAEQKLIRCDANDPHRCQASGQQGQCPYQAVQLEDGTWTKNCWRHGGNKSIEASDRKKLHDYRLHKWQMRMDEFSASENITSLRGEVGILRMTLEETLNMCDDRQSLLMFSSRIGDLVMKIDKLTNSLTKIEMKQGNLLDKSAALILAGQIVEIIGRYVTDPAAIDTISDELIDLIVQLAGKEPEELE